VTVLRKLSEVTNVVPIIAKSDSLTLQEREAFKERVSRKGFSKGRVGVADGVDLVSCRSGPSCSIIIFDCTLLTRRNMMRMRLLSTSGSG
jgi:hypothetical protein